jgi:urease alpha subunit
MSAAQTFGFSSFEGETYAVTADGELLLGEPAGKPPMAQRCFLF